MKNKTLTLIFSVILLASLFTACGRTLNKEISLSPKNKIKEINETDINTEALNNAISKSVLKTHERLADSELNTEGHVLIGTELNKNIITTYVIASVNNYGVQNNILTSISGSGIIPTIIKFEVNPENDRYTELEYIEASNPTDFHESVKAFFPEKYHEDALNFTYITTVLMDLQVKQAEEYLDFIDLDIPIKPFIEKDIISIIDNNNFSKQAPNFPNWEGSLEILEKGKRYTYSSSETQIDGKTFIHCKKIDEKNNIIMEFIVNENGEIKTLDKDSTTD
ncbi:MAG: hypothetical protein ACRC6T_01225 [Sarcina sp.]